MPAKRELSMRQLRHLLRLHDGGVSAREIGRRLGVARSTVQDNLKRAAAAGLAWPLAEDVADDALELRLFGRAGKETGQRRRIEPDWAALARELKRPGVTMMILWEEYREVNREGYGYSRFCDLLRGFERRLSPVMRQHHVAGEKAFVDYSGKRISIVDPTTGEIHEAEIFVRVLGASNLTYAEATWTQQLPDWTGAHVRMFRFFGGAPKLLVPDNLKSGVNKASFYDPEINRTYGAMAAHYSVGILPARPNKPRDKAKVEAGVRFAQTYILGRLRAQTFFSLVECNEAIKLVMQRMNERTMRHLGLSRRELFEKIERAALNGLPAEDWEFAEWWRARVNLDYHIEVHDFLYSVPHALLRAEVEVRVTARTVEVFHRGQRVAVHQRRYMGRKHGTDPDHIAQFPPVLRRVDAGSVPPLGRQDRTQHRRPDQRRARQPAAPRTGVPHLPGHSALLSRPRRGTRRSGLGPRARTGRPQLQGRRRASRPQARRRRGQGRPSRPASRSRQSAWSRLLPLRGRHMLAHPTLDQLHALGLHGLAKGFKELEHKPEARSLDHAEWLGLLLEYELTLRRQKQFETRARVAKLRHSASVEDVNYQKPRGLDRALFLKLAACDWIAERRNLLITGASGLGKSWLACALGHKACRENISVLYTRIPRLFADLAIAHGDARYARLLRSIARVRLLILDDWGPEALTSNQARDMLEIVEDRYDNGSLIITSQVPIDRWHDLIGVPTLADAILDRIVHNAYRIELSGESLRKRHSSS